jgi:hypothetical protein
MFFDKISWPWSLKQLQVWHYITEQKHIGASLHEPTKELRTQANEKFLHPLSIQSKRQKINNALFVGT